MMEKYGKKARVEEKVCRRKKERKKERKKKERKKYMLAEGKRYYEKIGKIL